jgi:hypothetical protein
MSDLPKLRDDHFRLMGIVRRLGALIESAKAPPQLHLFALRHELTSILIAHLKAEDWVVYPQLLASADRHVAATARMFSEEMGGLAAAYQAHCEQWNAGAIAEDWTAYRVACRDILDALTVRITREERELFPLVQTLAHAA